MVDVSGSMHGTPMSVAIALGILASEITHESFRNRVLTFSEVPLWFDLSGEKSFVKKTECLKNASWGYSTNFYAAAKLICDVVREKKLGADKIPDLLVISDMQFNEAAAGEVRWVGGAGPQGASWNLVQDNIRDMFGALGLELFGKPLDPPHIIFWNVRANTVGFPAPSDSKGVVMLSGYSPAFMKFVLSGEMTEEMIVGVDSTGNAVKERKKSTPQEALYKSLYDSGLDDVRAVLDAMPTETFLVA
jgi:hypothetical protein